MQRWLPWFLLTMAGLGCGSSDTKPETSPAGSDTDSTVTPDTAANARDTATDDSASPTDDTGEPLATCTPSPWPEHTPQSATEALTLSGSTTAEWTVSLPEGTARGALAIGVTSTGTDEGDRACYQLNRVTVDGETWVHPPDDPTDQGLHCFTCPKRVAVRQGAGWYVFDHAAGIAEVTVQVSVRDCATGAPALADLGDPIPETVRVSVGLQPADAIEPIVLPIHLINASQFDVEDNARGALEAANAQFAEHGIALSVAGVTRVEVDESSVTYDGAERTDLRALLALAGEAVSEPGATGGIPVVLVDCLERTGLNPGRPEGMATNIPGMPASECLPDGVFLRMAQCLGPEPFEYPWSTDSLGKVMAHELGHFMGLYHSVEANGTEDALADTDANNLMHFRALNSTSTGLTASQATVIRTHATLLATGSSSE